MAESKEAREKAGTEAEHAPGQGGQFPTPENDEQAPKRQFVSFFFFKIDAAWRRLPEAERAAHKAAFAEVWQKHARGGEIICRSYSTVGVRSDVDLMLWRVSYKLDAIQDMTADLLKTPLGGYLTPGAHLLGMTKRSVYEDKLNPNHEDARRLPLREDTRLVPLHDGGAPADDGRAHHGRVEVQPGEAQYDV
jgi:chlorite dismutase